jgi:hypothetical protein
MQEAEFNANLVSAEGQQPEIRIIAFLLINFVCVVFLLLSLFLRKLYVTFNDVNIIWNPWMIFYGICAGVYKKRHM